VFFLVVTIAYGAAPRLTSVEPITGKPGDELVASGQNLDSENVTNLFFTAGGKDFEVEIKEQTSDSIRFTIPEKIELGSYNLMVQTGGATPALMEQPVRCTVEDEEMERERLEEEAALQEELEEEAASEEEEQAEPEQNP
jgi:hypothetical protein